MSYDQLNPAQQQETLEGLRPSISKVEGFLSDLQHLKFMALVRCGSDAIVLQGWTAEDVLGNAREWAKNFEVPGTLVTILILQNTLLMPDAKVLQEICYEVGK